MAIKFKLLHKIVKGRHTFFLRGRYLGTDRALKLKTLYLHVQIGSGAKIIFFVYFFSPFQIQYMTQERMKVFMISKL